MAHVLIVGANGGIGRQAVELALREGHQVTAVLRTPAKLPLTHPHLTLVKGDILQPETFEYCLKGTDAVISAIGIEKGFFRDERTTLYSQGNANLLQAMQRTGVRRAYFISASAIEISPVLPAFVRFAAKYIVQRLLKHMYADLRKMEQVIKSSQADYTIIRPPRLMDKPVTGHYRVAIDQFLKNAFSISRADVAHFMLHNIDNTATYRTTVEIAY